MLHPWLFYLSMHLFSEVSIMSNEYTWIWICHHMCIFTCKIARIYAHVFIYYREYTDKIILSPVSPLYILHHCSLNVCLFTDILLFSFLLLFSFFLLLSLFSLSPQRFCYAMLCMPFFHRHSLLIDCKIVIRDVFSFLIRAQLKAMWVTLPNLLTALAHTCLNLVRKTVKHPVLHGLSILFHL